MQEGASLKVQSLLDNDTYKFSMQQAVLKKFPYAQAEYRFFNRNPKQQITKPMIDRIQEKILACQDLALTDDEANFLLAKCPYLQPWYVDWLRQFRLNAKHVKIYNSPTLSLDIEGPWCDTIYWEVPLLAIITEEIMKAQKELGDEEFAGVEIAARIKGRKLAENNCKFADFGTRRRFSYEVHDAVIQNLEQGAGGSFIGTSNVHFAMKYGLTPIGTMAHEWIQAISGLVGLRHANRFALDAWNDVYKGSLGIALTDTFGSAAFFKDFDGVQARLFDGLRHDSGDPLDFLAKAVAHYKSLGIDSKTKTIIYSDSLNVGKCAFYQRATAPSMKCAFGIGTHLTNDVPGTTPANIVIKLVEIDGIPVVKLSDDPGKAIGDPKAIDVAKWTFGIA